MTNLTEKWKNGELEDGWYYVETNEPFKPSKVIILEYYRTSFESDIDSNYIYKILAPVPSYKEWWKLKQLLGKCYRFLRLTETKVEAIEKVKRGLVKEIDEVLE